MTKSTVSHSNNFNYTNFWWVANIASELVFRIYGFSVISFTGVSHTVQALLHIFFFPLHFFSRKLHVMSRIWLVRLSWSPIYFALWLANVKILVTGDDPNIDGHPSDSCLPEVEGRNKFILLANHQVLFQYIVLCYKKSRY